MTITTSNIPVAYSNLRLSGQSMKKKTPSKKMTMKQPEGSAADKKADKKELAAMNAKKMPKKK